MKIDKKVTDAIRLMRELADKLERGDIVLLQLNFDREFGRGETGTFRIYYFVRPENGKNEVRP